MPYVRQVMSYILKQHTWYTTGVHRSTGPPHKLHTAILHFSSFWSQEPLTDIHRNGKGKVTRKSLLQLE